MTNKISRLESTLRLTWIVLLFANIAADLINEHNAKHLFVRGGGGRSRRQHDSATSSRQLKAVIASTKRPPPTRRPTKSPSKAPTVSPISKTNASNDSLDFKEKQHELLIANKAKWDAFLLGAGDDNTMPSNNGYEMVYQEKSIVYEYSLPYRVIVSKEGMITQVQRVEDGSEVIDPSIFSRMRTVEWAFNRIKVSLPDAVNVTVTYDPSIGYPKYVYIDESYEIVDEEIEFTINNVILIFESLVR